MPKEPAAGAPVGRSGSITASSAAMAAAALRSSAAARKRPTTKQPKEEPAGDTDGDSREQQLIRRLRRERLALQEQLVEAVQEIGVLRRYEQRVERLERELAERDALIASLRERPREPAPTRPLEDLQGRLL